jgi:hypothetical protein
MRRIASVLFLVAIVSSPAIGDTTFVDEKFDQYNSDAALIAVWAPRIGSGHEPAPTTDAAILTSDDALFPGIQGKAVDHIGGAVNQWEPASGGPLPGSEVVPTETQSVFLSVDFFDGASGNERMTIGLRNRTSTANIIEMGLYNSNSCDPFVEGCGATTSPQNSTMTTPGFYPGTGYATRTQLFSGFTPPLVTQADWQYFQLPIELDRPEPDDMDTIVGIADIGPGWHRYTATITPELVTYTIDLFRDGVTNKTRDENGVVVGVGDPGVDATMEFPMSLNSVGFDSLRIGGPSGLSSAGTGATGFDNILLQLIDVVTPGNSADFNGNGTIDAADYVVWRNNTPLMGGATQSQGDANGDGNVDDLDYELWRAGFGSNVPGGGLGAAAAVPEPASLALALVAMVALRALRGHRC